jgi:hypothetical protein
MEGRKFLGNWGRKEWFSCVQFDLVAARMGATLANRRRYCWGSTRGAKARYDLRGHFIAFDKSWFMSLSPKARCATVAHELWHNVTVTNTIEANRQYRRRLLLGSFLISGIIGLVIEALDLAVSSHPYPVLGLLFIMLILWLVIVFFRQESLMKRYAWPLEFAADEAGVRFFGLAATIEVLESLRTRWKGFTHPSVGLRIQHATEALSRYPEPILDFARLEGEIRQEFVLLEEGHAS